MAITATEATTIRAQRICCMAASEGYGRATGYHLGSGVQLPPGALRGTGATGAAAITPPPATVCRYDSFCCQVFRDRYASARPSTRAGSTTADTDSGPGTF